MYCKVNLISTRPQTFLVNRGLLAYLSAVCYSINSRFTLKVSVYEYFIKFGGQTKKQLFKSAVRESFVEFDE